MEKGKGEEISPTLKTAFEQLKQELLALKQCHNSLENMVSQLKGKENDT